MVDYYDRQKDEMYDLGLKTYISAIDSTNSEQEADKAVAFVNKKYIKQVGKLELNLLELDIRNDKLWF